MSNRQRPSLKGRGSSIFFSEDAADPTEEASSHVSEASEDRQQRTASIRVDGNYSGAMKKLTFNLPLELSYGLDELQLKLRMATRSSVTKTEIVQAALERTIREVQDEAGERRLLADLGFDAAPAAAASTNDAD